MQACAPRAPRFRATAGLVLSAGMRLPEHLGFLRGGCCERSAPATTATPAAAVESHLGSCRLQMPEWPVVFSSENIWILSGASCWHLRPLLSIVVVLEPAAGTEKAWLPKGLQEKKPLFFFPLLAGEVTTRTYQRFSEDSSGENVPENARNVPPPGPGSKKPHDLICSHLLLLKNLIPSSLKK